MNINQARLAGLGEATPQVLDTSSFFCRITGDVNGNPTWSTPSWCLKQPPPPVPAPAGSPQTETQMKTQSGTPGGYSTEQSIADSQAASIARWNAFYGGLNTGSGTGSSGGTSGGGTSGGGTDTATPSWCDWVPFSSYLDSKCSTGVGAMQVVLLALGAVVIFAVVQGRRR